MEDNTCGLVCGFKHKIARVLKFPPSSSFSNDVNLESLKRKKEFTIDINSSLIMVIKSEISWRNKFSLYFVTLKIGSF